MNRYDNGKLDRITSDPSDMHDDSIDETPRLHPRRGVMRLPRWMHHAYANVAGYFWLPCPLCDEPFGGHEWLPDTQAQPSAIPDPEGSSSRVGICPDCTRRGLGSRAVDIEPERLVGADKTTGQRDFVDEVAAILQPLYTAVEVVLLDHEDELAGERVDANLAELAHRYQQLTGWTVETERSGGES